MGILELIYYGSHEPVVQDRSTFSSCQPKNGQGDQRECPLSSTRDTQGYAGDPINTRTGGFDYSPVDLSIPTAAGPLMFQRTYSSLATDLYTTTLGYGWTHNHDTHLIFPNDPGGEVGVVWFKAHTANQYRFDISGNDFTAYPGVLASLAGDAINGYTLVDESQNEYLFDGEGKLLTWSDPQDHTFTYTYTNGSLSRVADPSGQRYLDFSYNQGRLETVSDHAGREVSFGYTGGNLTSFTDVLDQPWTYTYTDPNYPHHLIEVIDPRPQTALRVEYDAQGRAGTQYDGKDQTVVSLTYNPDGTSIIEDGNANTITHTYDSRNTLVGVSTPLGSELEKSYSYSFRPATVTDPNDHTTALSWSMDGANLLGAVDADGKSLEMSYDNLNNLTTLVDRRGYTTTFTYAGKLLTSRSDALEHTTTYTYTTAADWPQPPGLLKQVMIPINESANQRIEYGYDVFGQAAEVTDTLGNPTLYSYDNLGRLETLTDALGRVTRYEYNAAGRLLNLTRNYDPARPQNDADEYNIVTEYGYDQVGNLSVVTDTLGYEMDYLYDENNRLLQVSDALGNQTSYDYDPNGNLVAKTNANNVVTFYEYDALNQLKAVVENYRPGFAADHETNVRSEYSYDPAGNLTAVRDARAVLESRQDVTVYTYDALNRLASESDPLDNTTHYGYDPEGNRTVITDTLNAVTQYAYDPLGQLTAIDYPSPDADVSFTYNFAGWQTSMTDGLGVTTWDYDDLGRVESVTDPFNQVVGYDYDNIGNRSGLTYPDTKSVGYVYDSLDRLETVTDWTQQVTQYDYDPLSRLEGALLPGGMSSSYSYDALGQVKSIDHLAPVGALASYKYAYDPLGNRSAVTETLTQPLADLIFADGFEAGDFRGWSGTKTTSPPDLSVTTTAAMYGKYGEKAAPVNGRTAFAYDNSPQAEKRYRARFYFDPNNVTVGSSYSYAHTIFKATNADYTGGSQGTAVFLLEFRKQNLTTYQVRAAAFTSQGWTYTAWQTIANAPNAIEVEWKAATTSGGSNGYLNWWLGDTAKTGLTSLKNGALAVESAFLGAVDGVDSGASGWYCFDAFVSRRENKTGLEPGGAQPCGGSADGLLNLSMPEALTATLALTETQYLTATFEISAALLLTETGWISAVVPFTDTGYLSGSLTLPESGWLSATLEAADPGVGGGIALLAGGSTARIDYTYDPLGRLTAADYSPWTYFHYQYDPAGNRTLQTACIGVFCSPVVTDYVYDDAQRLTSVNEVNYSWDGNGNLLSDGVNTYTYNHANRLTAVSGPQNAVSFGYNGLGDRLQQTTGGATTRYALDLNNSLAQVLSDGSNTYLYGLDRIAQQNIVGRQYYFGDALGSMRQLVNPAGTVIQARSFEPFGKQFGAAGNPFTKYGFTGEWTDPTNLIYLRARYYDPATGRFLSKDLIRGLIVLPGTLNLYTYVSNNPINFYDPTGYNFISDKIKNWLDFFNNYNTPLGTPPPPNRPSQTPGPPIPNINQMFPTFSTCSRQSPCIKQAGTSTPTPTPTPTPLSIGEAVEELLDMYQPELNYSWVNFVPQPFINHPIVNGLLALQIFSDAYWWFNDVYKYWTSNRPTATPLLPCLVPSTPTP